MPSNFFCFAEPSNFFLSFIFMLQVQYTYDDMNTRHDLPAPKSHVKHLLGKGSPLSIDYKYKVRSCALYCHMMLQM